MPTQKRWRGRPGTGWPAAEIDNLRAALDGAFHDLAASGSDSNDQLFGEHTIGIAEYFIGDQVSTRHHLERVLSNCPLSDQPQNIAPFQDVIRFGTDVRVAARVYLARVMWLQEYPDQAVRTTETVMAEAQATGHALSLCYALTLAACQVSLWTGDLAAAEHHTRMLVDQSGKHSPPLWRELGARLQSVVWLKGDNVEAGLRPAPVGSGEIVPSNFNFLILLGESAAALAYAGRIAEAPRLVDQAIDLSEADWLTPGFFRIKDEISLAQRTSGAAQTAEQLFRHAQDGPRRQEALAWELRAATSLARLLRRQGHSDDAAVVLRPVYDRFPEGLGTADLIAAKQLLDKLGIPGRD